MKTTIDISNSLFKETKRFASTRNKSFKDLVESALRMFLNNQKGQKTKFSLKKQTFKGQGLSAGLSEGNWDGIRALIYEGRNK